MVDKPTNRERILEWYRRQPIERTRRGNSRCMRVVLLMEQFLPRVRLAQPFMAERFP